MSNNLQFAKIMVQCGVTSMIGDVCAIVGVRLRWELRELFKRICEMVTHRDKAH